MSKDYASQWRYLVVDVTNREKPEILSRLYVQQGSADNRREEMDRNRGRTRDVRVVPVNIEKEER